MKYVAYLRVSTRRQGVSGLGLESQRQAVAPYAPVAEYVEVESGKRAARPELVKAIARARKEKAVLVVAKIDRLARNAHFLLGILESGVDVLFCDLPELPPGPMGKFFLTMMAAVAELEGGMISDRTKAALAQAKARGVVLGRAGKDLAAANRNRADAAARALEKDIQDLTGTYVEKAEALNRKGVKTPGNGAWHPETVRRVERRLAGGL